MYELYANSLERAFLFRIFFRMFGRGDASGHRSRRSRDGAGHVIVFEGRDRRGEGDVAGVGSVVRHVGSHADNVSLGDVAVIRQSRRNLRTTKK